VFIVRSVLVAGPEAQSRSHFVFGADLPLQGTSLRLYGYCRSFCEIARRPSLVPLVWRATAADASNIDSLAASANTSDDAVDLGVFLIKAQLRIRLKNIYCGWLMVTHRR
jgi:hypothetical protein